MVSLAAQEWMRQGKALGVAEGKALGVAEGKALGVAEGEARALARSILRTLTARFGPVSEAIEARVRGLPRADLDALFDRALTAPNLESVFGESGRH